MFLLLFDMFDRQANIREIQELLSQNPDIANEAVTKSSHNSALHRAVKSRNPEVVNLLVGSKF